MSHDCRIWLNKYYLKQHVDYYNCQIAYNYVTGEIINLCKICQIDYRLINKIYL